jgi:hypothetical protein
MRTASGEREIMRRKIYYILIVPVLLAIQPVHNAAAQENVYELYDFMDLPSALKIHPDSSCTMESREVWTVDAQNFTISKKVDSYTVPCGNQIPRILSSGEEVRLKGITYEFSFLDPHQTPIQSLQDDIVTMVSHRIPGKSLYNLSEQLLSVRFHEEWIFEPENQEIIKIVSGITPVIWQKRQTTEGEAVNDAETGLPVYYTLQLDRINLRHP